MGLIFRQSLKSSIGFYIGVVLGAINTLFISTKFLTPDQLAISRILLENSLIFAAFSHLGTPYISDKFFAKFKDDAAGHNGFLVYLLTFPLLGFLIFLWGFNTFNEQVRQFFSEKSPTVIPYISLTLPITFFWIYILVLESYCRANGRTAVPTMLREAVFRGIAIVLAVFLGLGYINFTQFLYFFTGAIGLIAVSLVYYIFHLGKFYFTWQRTVWSRAIIYQMVSFGVIIIVGGVGANLILFLDRNLLANKVGTTAVAIFTIAVYIAAVIEIPSKAIKQISGPILAEAMYMQDYVKVKELYQKSSLNLMLIGGITFLLIAFNLDSLLYILPKSEIYRLGKWVVIVIGLAKWIDMSLGLNNEVITYSKYYKVNTVVIISMAALAVYLNLRLIPPYGVLGSAIATASITLIAAIIRLLFVNNKFHLLPFSAADVNAALVLIVVGVLGFLLPSVNTSFLSAVFSIGYKSVLMLWVFSYLVVRYNVSTDLTLVYNNYILPFLKVPFSSGK